jgi:hypothetical protein
MDKFDMRDWVSSVERAVDQKLSKWKKQNPIENGEAVQLRWQWEQTHFQLDIFWENGRETVNLMYSSPRVSHTFHWHGLDDKTFNKIMDRIGNLAQVTMHPPIDFMDDGE